MWAAATTAPSQLMNVEEHRCVLQMYCADHACMYLLVDFGMVLPAQLRGPGISLNAHPRLHLIRFHNIVIE